MLMHYRIPGYSLEDHLWYLLNVEHLQVLQRQDDAIDHVVLPENRRYIIEAFVESESLGSREHGPKPHLDPTQGKHKGSILLFHGPPGVGKTLLAEAIGEKLGNPVLSISGPDLGTSLINVKTRFLKFSSLADHWHCTVVLQNAEVFFARAGRDELERSLILSGTSHSVLNDI